MTYTGRQPRVFVFIDTGVFAGREQLPPRRVPRFAPDGVIHFGADSTLIGPWKPWRVRHRFVQLALPEKIT